MPPTDDRTRSIIGSVWRACDQHECTLTPTSPCVHHNHRRDIAFLAAMLDMLGVVSPDATSSDSLRIIEQGCDEQVFTR